MIANALISAIVDIYSFLFLIWDTLVKTSAKKVKSTGGSAGSGEAQKGNGGKRAKKQKRSKSIETSSPTTTTRPKICSNPAASNAVAPMPTRERTSS